MNWAALMAEVATGAMAGRLALNNLRAPVSVLPGPFDAEHLDGLVLVDLVLQKGRIAAIAPAGAAPPTGIDMGGRMVWPATVDCHTHIDKGHVWPRSPNPDGTFQGAITVAGLDTRTYQSPEDLRARAGFALACAHAHGTAHLRSHLDADPATLDTRVAVMKEVVQDWAGRVDVQLCPFSGTLDDADWLQTLARAAQTTGDGVLSLFLQDGPDLDQLLDSVMRCALDHGLVLDFHADENLDPASDCLGAIARSALRLGYDGPILVGHCCALSVQDDDTVSRTLDLVAKTRIGIVALPLCNMYLQDRTAAVSPRQRGIAPLKEIAARGIPVAIGSDNTRDAFYAYGDLDAPELFRDALRMMQLDHPVSDWPATVTSTAADLIGASDRGRLRVGGAADLILFSARNWSEFAARPTHDRFVLRAGRPIDTTPPEFADLDMLKGMMP